jgi:hypothetical protein
VTIRDARDLRTFAIQSSVDCKDRTWGAIRAAFDPSLPSAANHDDDIADPGPLIAPNRPWVHGWYE